MPRGDAVLWGRVNAREARSVMDGCGLGYHLSCAA